MGVKHQNAGAVPAAPVTPTLFNLFINNEFVPATTGETFEVTDPRSGNKIGDFASAGKADVNAAVNAARKAFDEGPWPRMSGQERAKLMHKLADLIDERLERLAQLESLDNGKPIGFSKGADIPFSSSHFRYMAGWADKIYGEVTPHDSKQGKHFSYCLKEPVGVVGAIIPWNFPMLMAAWKLAPALAAGCTVVLKPSEKTPITALELGQLFKDAGFPEGVVNIVPGMGPSAGEAISKHEGIDKLAFTGSVPTAMRIKQVAGIKPISLELGGKSPAIVFKDVNVDEAVDKVHFGLFFNHGQCCCASSRVFVHESIYDEFVAKSALKAQERRVGDPFGTVDQGPQVDEMQFEKVMGYIDTGKQEGLNLVTGGNRAGNETGYYIEPTIFKDVPDTSKLFREEIFGPVMAISKFSSEEDVIRRLLAKFRELVRVERERGWIWVLVRGKR